MRVAFVGKGGSGKTALSALFAQWLAREGAHVIAIDADINQHLGVALGLSERDAASLPAMGAELPFIKDRLRGSNPRIRSASVMTKTTPPGRGSRLLRLSEPDPIFERLAWEVGGIRLMATGPFTDEDLGVACYHSKTGAVELLLNHLLDEEGEYVVVDMTAGADSFASGLFSRFDLMVLVAEPTLRAVSVHRQYRTYGADFDIPIVVVGNKVEDQTDETFLREAVGEDLLACFGRSAHVRAMEKGMARTIDLLEEPNRRVLHAIRTALDIRERDWRRSYEFAVEFHRRNAVAWANTMIGEDVAAQIDPDFTLDPRLVSLP